MKTYVIWHSVARLEAFLKRHALADPVALPASSIYKTLNSLIASSPEPILLLSDNLYLDSGFYNRAVGALEHLERDYAGWGVAGNQGVSPSLYGLGPSNRVCYATGPGVAPNLPGRVLPLMWVAGPLLINLPALAAGKARLPDFGSADFFELCLSLASCQAGLGCYAMPELTAFASQKPLPQKEAADSFVAWLSDEVANRHLEMPWGMQHLPAARGQLDWPRQALTNCATGPRRVAIVVRTRLARPHTFFRTLQSIQAFMAASCFDIFSCHVVTDNMAEKVDLPAGVELARFDFKGEDSRVFLLTRAVESIDADYFWFVDDDDWLFPNRAVKLAATILANPPESTFYIGTSWFTETDFPGGWSGNTRAIPGRYYDPAKFADSIGGANHIPFCGIVFPAKALAGIFDMHEMPGMLYLEDYCLQLLNLYRHDFFPVVLDRLFVGISIRECGNTVTEQDRTRWNISASAMYPDVLASASILISVGQRSVAPLPTREEILAGIPFAELRQLVKRKFINKGKKIIGRFLGPGSEGAK